MTTKYITHFYKKQSAYDLSGLGRVGRLFLGGTLLALEVGLATLAFDYFVVLFAHDV